MTKEQKLRRGDLRDALLDYARAATEAGHIETMSLRQAARDLGVSSGAVYRHFEDKNALLVELTMQGHEEMRGLFLAIRPENEPAKDIQQALDRTRQFVKTYIDFAIAKPALWHMMFGRVGMMCRDQMMQDVEKMRYTPFDASGQNLADLYRLGVLSRQPGIADLRYIWSATHGAADLAQSGARMDADQLDQVIEDTVVRNLRSVGYTGPDLTTD